MGLRNRKKEKGKKKKEWGERKLALLIH